MSDDTPDKIPTYDEALPAVKQPYRGRWWAIIGVILVLVYPLFYLFTPLTNEQIHLSVNDVTPFLKETVMAFILFPLLLIISFTVFLRWKRVGDWFAKWKPEKTEPLTLIQINASIIVGVLILLSFTIGATPGPNETDIKLIVTGPQKVSHINGFDVKSSTSNEVDIKPWVTALTASVVAQFAISTILVALFSNERIVWLLNVDFPIDEVAMKHANYNIEKAKAENAAKWGSSS